MTLPTSLSASQATLRGTVVDSLTGGPLQGARVYVSPVNVEAWSSADGAFQIGPLPPGRYEIQFEVHRYEPRAFTFALDSLAMREHDLGRIPLTLADSLLVTMSGLVQGPDSAVVGATVSLNDHMLGITGFDGMFAGSVRLPVGLNVLQVRAMGYAPATELMWFGGDDSLVTVNISLEAFPVRLPDMVVEGDGVRGRLDVFHRHRQSEMGTFLYGEALETARSRTVTDILRRVPGVLVMPGANTVRLSRAPNTPNCAGDQPQFFVDGRPLHLGSQMSINDVIKQDHVIAVEVYNGAAQVPGEYNRGNAACGGVIVIWTRL